jgi:hypothetical protein
MLHFLFIAATGIAALTSLEDDRALRVWPRRLCQSGVLFALPAFGLLPSAAKAMKIGLRVLLSPTFERRSLRQIYR